MRRMGQPSPTTKVSNFSTPMTPLELTWSKNSRMQFLLNCLERNQSTRTESISNAHHLPRTTRHEGRRLQRRASVRHPSNCRLSYFGSSGQRATKSIYQSATTETYRPVRSSASSPAPSLSHSSTVCLPFSLDLQTRENAAFPRSSLQFFLYFHRCTSIPSCHILRW